MLTFNESLRRLVALNTVSPLTHTARLEVSGYLKTWGFSNTGSDDLWVKDNGYHGNWIYSHIDTKPAIPLEEWQSDPWSLSERDGMLYGLGISDAKFQLLNLLMLRAGNFNIIVDGAEEIGGNGASAYLRSICAKKILVVDGSSATNEIYCGTMGQLDGKITISTGLERIHPARRVQDEPVSRLIKLMNFVALNKLHFNITELSSPKHERSLTMEEMSIRFDLRYGPEQAGVVREFVQEWSPEVRQNYLPFGRSHKNFTRASFSTALGNGFEHDVDVCVVPGGLPENGNHRPNEWIYPHQIVLHANKLSHAISYFFGGTT